MRSIAVVTCAVCLIALPPRSYGQRFATLYTFMPHTKPYRRACPPKAHNVIIPKELEAEREIFSGYGEP
jgi:hypothetical protein